MQMKYLNIHIELAEFFDLKIFNNYCDMRASFQKNLALHITSKI